MVKPAGFGALELFVDTRTAVSSPCSLQATRAGEGWFFLVPSAPVVEAHIYQSEPVSFLS